MAPVTEEQRKQIEENRKRALAKKADKAHTNQPGGSASTSTSYVHVHVAGNAASPRRDSQHVLSSEQKACIERSKQQAMAKLQAFRCQTVHYSDSIGTNLTSNNIQTPQRSLHEQSMQVELETGLSRKSVVERQSANAREVSHAGGSSSLTFEQRQMIEQKRLAAIAKKAERSPVKSHPQSTGHMPGPYNSSSTNCLSPELKRRMEQNRLQALARRSATKNHASCISSTLEASSSPSAVANTGNQRQSDIHVSTPVASTALISPDQKRRMENNRLEALAKRTEKGYKTPEKLLPSTEPNNAHTLSPEQRRRMEENIQQAVVRRAKSNLETRTSSCNEHRVNDDNVTASLSPEQKRRMELNRQQALDRKAKKNVQSPEKSRTSPCTSSAISPEQKERIEFNRKKALARRALRLGDQKPDSSSYYLSKSSADTPADAVSAYSEEQKQRMEENRQKALAKRAGLATEPTCSGYMESTSVVRRINFADNSAGTSFSPGKVLQGRCLPIERDRFEVEVGYCKPLIEVFKTIDTKQYDSDKKCWNFHKKMHTLLMNSIEPLQHLVNIQPLPSNNSTADLLCVLNKNRVKGNCSLISNRRFELDAPFCEPLVKVCKLMPSRGYNSATKRWSFDIPDHSKLMDAVKALERDVQIQPLPRTIVKLFSETNLNKVTRDPDLSAVPGSLRQKMFPFQTEGVRFGISKGGRVLIADDMGLGKTIQAIAIAAYYRNEWPVLVVSPSSVRFAWADQFTTWLPFLRPDDIKVIVTGNERLSSNHVNVISYDLLTRKKNELEHRSFSVVILDESHFFKSYKAARTKAILPICKSARRVILLSGTPALSRPQELFTQILAVCPKLFPNFHDFGLRYCAADKSNFGWDYSGSSNERELEIVLKETLMIRRVKTEVLDQLPEKRRQVIVLDPSSISSDKMSQVRTNTLLGGKLKGTQRRTCLMEYFSETSKLKAKAVGEYILDILEGDKKLIVFAHHKEMLDNIQILAESKGHKFIRIDGSVTSHARQQCCEKFQKNSDVRLAILSITAANTGINLTAASLVVFAELFWNPGTLFQAEDRAHRIGQTDSVLVQYLIANKTADDFIWPLVKSKLNFLGKSGLNNEKLSDAVATRMKDPKQKEILSFFKNDFIDDSQEINDMAGNNGGTLDCLPSANKPSSSRVRDWLNSIDDGTQEPPRKSSRLQ